MTGFSSDPIANENTEDQMTERNESNRDKPRGRTRRRRLVAGVAVAAVAAAAVAGVRYLSPPGGLGKSEIDEILKAALADKNTAPTDACVSLSGAELPADVTAASLLRVDGTVRKDVQALIDRGLITVKFDAGKGKPTIRNPDYELSDKPVRLSHIELTAFGKPYYRYQEIESTDPSSPGGRVLYMINLFCAHVSYGGVEKFMAPSKNPFDDNPHLVTWVNFLWKPDKQATPWLADPDLLGALSFYPEDDGWAHKGILLERDDNAHWALGNNPYTIRW
ncbi:hypothetical protein [Burkholderia aenigmatica]|uniref:Uncharacterized protein n=1 Tax=Burkholderia aenigmatica TaxID=2015348 RepID=A0A228IVT3_9BURK|nr:hypothetical protein [Burkholderia aenigmatica]OXI46185.1 hypothetical protein CFB84_15310 [Burkholderia aenigmatica]